MKIVSEDTFEQVFKKTKETWAWKKVYKKVKPIVYIGY